MIDSYEQGVKKKAVFLEGGKQPEGGNIWL